jgi:hypothetical protein
MFVQVVERGYIMSRDEIENWYTEKNLNGKSLMKTVVNWVPACPYLTTTQEFNIITPLKLVSEILQLLMESDPLCTIVVRSYPVAEVPSDGMDLIEFMKVLAKTAYDNDALGLFTYILNAITEEKLKK